MEFEERLCAASSTLEKKLLIVGELTRRLATQGIRPIIVGGTAVEIYSLGAYQTYDIDLVVAQREQAICALEAMGFERAGRVWFHPSWEMVIEIPDTHLAGDTARINRIDIDGYQVDCIGLEDLILDRLNAAVYWRSSEDRRWVGILLGAYGDTLDYAYLRERAGQEGTLPMLEELLQEV
jgi:predicted nucleotidyltransferase